MAASPEKMAGSALLPFLIARLPPAGGEKAKKDGGGPAKMAAAREREGSQPARALRPLPPTRPPSLPAPLLSFPSLTPRSPGLGRNGVVSAAGGGGEGRRGGHAAESSASVSPHPLLLPLPSPALSPCPALPRPGTPRSRRLSPAAPPPLRRLTPFFTLLSASVASSSPSFPSAPSSSPSALLPPLRPRPCLPFPSGVSGPAFSLRLPALLRAPSRLFPPFSGLRVCPPPQGVLLLRPPCLPACFAPFPFAPPRQLCSIFLWRGLSRAPSRSPERICEGIVV